MGYDRFSMQFIIMNSFAKSLRKILLGVNSEPMNAYLFLKGVPY